MNKITKSFLFLGMCAAMLTLVPLRADAHDGTSPTITSFLPMSSDPISPSGSQTVTIRVIWVDDHSESYDVNIKIRAPDNSTEISLVVNNVAQANTSNWVAPGATSPYEAYITWDPPNGQTLGTYDLYADVTDTADSLSDVAGYADYADEITLAQTDLSGTVYTDEGSTNIGAGKTVRAMKNGSTLLGSDDTDASGDWAITDVSVVSGDIVTLYLDDETEKSTHVYVTDASTQTDLDLYQNTLIVRADTGSITNANLGTGDDGDADVLYSVVASALTVDSGVEVHVWTGDTYDPGGAVTTQGSANLHVDDSATAYLDTASNTIAGDITVDTGATLNIDANTSVNGGDITNTGTVTTSTGMPTVTVSGTGNIGGTFYNLTISGGGAITTGSAVSTNNDLTVSGSLAGTNSITIDGGDLTGSGSISMTGGTVTVNGTGSFGSSANWTFNDLTFGGTTTAASTSNITVSSTLSISGTLNAGSKTYILTGSGTPLSVSGTLNADTSTFSYRGTSATTVTNTTYNDVDFSPGSGTVTYSFAAGGGAGTAVKIDDASDFTDVARRSVVRTSGGARYAFVEDDGSCEIWKSAAGSSWSEMDSGNNPLCYDFRPGASMAIDGGDVIHLSYHTANTAVSYIAFDTATDTFGTEEDIITGLAGVSDTTIVVVDSNDKAHVLWSERDGTTDYKRQYSNRISGSWKAAVDVVSGLPVISSAKMILNEDDVPEVVYNQITDPFTVPVYAVIVAVGDANDSTSFSKHTLLDNLMDGASLAVDSGGNTWLAVTNGPDDLVKLFKHNDGDAWTTWQAAVTNNNQASLAPSIVINGTDVYIFYEDENNDIVFDMYDGSSWEGETSLHAGTYLDPVAKWQTINNNSPSVIDYVYRDASDVYYNTYDLSGSGGSSVASGDVTLGGAGDVTLDANTNSAIVDINGNFTIGSGDTYLASASAAFTIAGNFTNNGTFTHNDGTVTFDTAGTSIISGATTFYNFTSTTGNKTIQFNDGETFTFATGGTFTITGTEGNEIIIDSDNDGVQWNVDLEGSDAVTYADIEDSGCDGTSGNIDLSDGTSLNSGNNAACWQFPQTDFSGTVFTDEGSTNIGAGKTVKIIKNGSTVLGTEDTDASGNWSLTDVAVLAGDIITLYIDDETEKATAVFVTDAVAQTDLDLYQDTLIVRADTGSITHANLATGDDADADIIYSVAAGALTVNSGVELHVWTGDAYDPGGAVTTQGGAHLHVDDSATAYLDTATSTVAGDITVDTGATLNIDADASVDGGDITATGTVTTSTGTPTVTVSGTGNVAGTFHNLTISATGTSTAGGAITVNNDLTITGSLTGTNSITIGGDFTNNGTFTHDDGTVTFDTSGTSVISGATTFYNFTSTTAGKTIRFNDGETFTFATGGTFTITGGSGNEIVIDSDSDGVQWIIDLEGSAAVTYADVEDSGCDGTSGTISADDGTSLNGGNNDSCWDFGVMNIHRGGSEDGYSILTFSGQGGAGGTPRRLIFIH